MTCSSLFSSFRTARLAPLFAVGCLVLAASRAPAAPLPPEAAAQERALIRQLQSDAPPAEKARACKQLVLCGTAAAVPALAPLLADAHLASWARIPLEVIPGPEAEAALRRGLDTLQGQLLIGVINSIAVRRDARAVGGLVKKLKGADPAVAAAAAEALGRIGNGKATRALRSFLAVAPDAVRPAVAQGCILGAERRLAGGKAADAVKLYDAVRAAPVPAQRRREAIRGAILARQSAGLPLLLEQLRSPDPDLFGIGLRTARELPGRPVTEALAAELARCRPERQSFLLLALADRGDAAAMPTLLDAASRGPQKLRLTAVGILDRLGSVGSMPTLLKVAADPDAGLSSAALAALARLPGPGVDSALLELLRSATGKNREVLITLAGQRHMERALPEIVRAAAEPEAGIRRAAAQAIGILGGDAQAGDLARLLEQTRNPAERADLEAALLAISSRAGARTVPHLQPLARAQDPALRILALHALASAGGPEALAAVQAAVQDSEAEVRDEAVRTLSTWPNNWPDDNAVAAPLLALARSGARPAHQVLALRGYLQHLQGNKQLKDGDKADKIKDAWPLLKRPEEKRQAIAALGTLPVPGALDLLVTLAGDSAVAEDACAAIVKLAGAPMPAVPESQRQQALRTVVEKTATDATREEARKLLKPAP